jgi:hypothetical protein
MYILEELFKKGVLQKDPNNTNNMFVYRHAGKTEPEGWYSENIASVATELFNNKKDLQYIISVAQKNQIDTDKCFENAAKMIY